MPFLLALFSFWMATAQAAPSELDSLWEESLAAHASGDLTRATTALSAWTDRAAKVGIRSSQSHYNLASLYWANKQPGLAAYHLLTSLTLSANPFQNWRGLSTLAEIEKALGVKDGVSQGLSFRLGILFPSTFVWWMGALAGWSLVATFLAWITKHSAAAHSLLILGLVAGLIGAAAHVNRTYYNDVAVLLKNDDAISVYRVPQKDDKALLLVELPSGTLVQRGDAKQGEFSEITSPVAGWVATDTLQKVN